MADFKSKMSGFLSGLKRAAGDAVETQEIALARGKSASKPVYTDAGVMIVDTGREIDDDVIEMARKHGKLSALAASAVASRAQDFREKARNIYGATPEGVEAHSMASSEQYLEARHYIGRIAAVDVTDLRGNIIVPAGRKIEDEDVRNAREADQLGSLIFSAQQSPPPQPMAAAPPPFNPLQQPGAAPANETKRAARPLTSYYDEEE